MHGERATETGEMGAPGAVGAARTTQVNLRYVDRADCMETFADSVNGLAFDGQSLRIEFGVTRLDEVKPNTPISGRRLPVVHLVLTPATAVELINRMQQTAAALAQAGVVKPSQPPASGAPTKTN
ncbi:MAG: hypothetical protein C5B56_09515 [Proteobacteria bacterium]|nr:MAG: hypothetical protein C5B56_09515 [Pseudomonadota bacterium]